MRLLIFLILLVSTSTYASMRYSMRSCAMLPVTDTAGHALGFRVYERLEEYLKDSNWCEYKSTASLLGIFSKYRERLSEHLQDPKVIRTVVERLRVGSILRIEMKFLVNKVELGLDIVAENGIDLYFKEKIIIDGANVENISEKLIDWLEIYEKSIPYDGQVLGVLGDQLTFSITGNQKKAIGQKFIVKRFKSKTRHKLLKTVVAWDFEELAEGKLFNISEYQALGIVKVYNTRKKIRAGDWIQLEAVTPQNILNKEKYEEAKANKFGKLGTGSVYFSVGNSTVGTSPKNGSVKMSGFTYGIAAEGEAWITRNYFASGLFSRTIGSLGSSSGDSDLKSANVSNGVIKISGGYKYLPMGFFYGPQVNLYAGYARYSYNVERSTIDGFGANIISGILVGVGGNMPLQRGIRIVAKGEIIPFASFDDEDNIFGSVKKTSSLHFKVGAEYKYAPSMTLDAGLEITNNSAKFSGDISEITYRDSTVKVGATFLF